MIFQNSRQNGYQIHEIPLLFVRLQSLEKSISTDIEQADHLGLPDLSNRLRSLLGSLLDVRDYFLNPNINK